MVKTLFDAVVSIIAYINDSASFHKGTPVISKPAADAHFVAAVDLPLNQSAGTVTRWANS
jgi:hypothetical protein